MNILFTEVDKKIRSATKILLTTHEHTDGDDLGTVLALFHHLRRQSVSCRVVIKYGVPNQLRFLPGASLVLEEIPANLNPDLLIFSGCSVKTRCNHPDILNLSAPIINFDHHPDNSHFGNLNLVDSGKSSVAELMYEFMQYNKYPLTPEIATCLLTGIFTDTGSFMHSNTKQNTLRAAAELMHAGASLPKISKHTYRGKNPFILKAWSRALQNTYYNADKQVIYSVLTDQDIEELKNIPLSAFEGFVETINKVPEAKVALFLKQDGSTIKGSLRSDPHKGINVQKVAKILGGGGHVWAAGFSIVGKLEKNPQGKWIVASPASPLIAEKIFEAKEFIKHENHLLEQPQQNHST